MIVYRTKIVLILIISQNRRYTSRLSSRKYYCATFNRTLRWSALELLIFQLSTIYAYSEHHDAVIVNRFHQFSSIDWRFSSASRTLSCFDCSYRLLIYMCVCQSSSTAIAVKCCNINGFIRNFTGNLWAVNLLQSLNFDWHRIFFNQKQISIDYATRTTKQKCTSAMMQLNKWPISNIVNCSIKKLQF